MYSYDAGVGLRVAPSSGIRVFTVQSRQSRPNRPAGECPFCPGGLEAPNSYDVHWFVNRWPSLPGNRCEVVLYSPAHDASLSSLEPDQVDRVIAMWAERTAALSRRHDVSYILIFENRGAEVGATIDHPHGQIYAFDFVPDIVLTKTFAEPCRESSIEREIARTSNWLVYVPRVSVFPYAAVIVPTHAVPVLAALRQSERRGLACVLIDTLQRFESVLGSEVPYMLWVHQRPCRCSDWQGPDLQITIVTPWRGQGLTRFIAAGELGSNVYFNPVLPEKAAAELRAAKQ